MRAQKLIRSLLLGAALLGCKRLPPPGEDSAREPVRVVRVNANTALAPDGVRAHGEQRDIELGSISDNLPFPPTQEKLASIAWRTWIYTDTGSSRTRYGYLRAGQVVERRGPAIVNDGCKGGWYRINPRGFVCVGKGATLDLTDPVVQAAQVRPRRGAGLPYLYAMAKNPSPYLYFRLPSADEMRRAETDAYLSNAVTWRSGIEASGLTSLINAAPEPPALFKGLTEIQKPYGTEQRLHYLVHSGQSGSDSGFAIASTFNWMERAWGLTTELDLIALDRTQVVRPSSFHGVSLEPNEDLPVAIVKDAWVTRYRQTTPAGRLESEGSIPRRSLLKLTGNSVKRDGRYWETRDGFWVPDAGLVLLNRRSDFPSVATGTRKWIDISIGQQTLVAYTGEKAEYVTLVSTGAGGMADPETTTATVRGTFMIFAKHVSETMDGEDDKSDSFNLRDVPFVQYFHKGYALHGAYWHDEFGRTRSHGCVNLAPMDAAWLFEWTDPAVPQSWHGVLNKERGTAVYIHQ